MKFGPVPPPDFTPRSVTITVETLEEFEALRWASENMIIGDIERLTPGGDVMVAYHIVNLLNELYKAITDLYP